MMPTAFETLTATPLYVGLNALIFLALTIRVIRLRIGLQVSLGDGEQRALRRAIRGQANAAETMPLALFIVFLTEVSGAPAFVVHALGVSLTLGRAMHGLHFILDSSPFRLRTAGMGATLLVYLFGGLGLLGHALAQLSGGPA